MLNQRPNAHLDKDELLQALVDVGDLAAERRSHLQQCTDCQKDLKRLQQGFERLEQTARQNAPSPPRPFRLPQKAAQKVRWQFMPIWATATVAAMVFAAVLWWPRLFEPPARVPDVARQNSDAGDALLYQVDDLVDNALPPVLQQLAATSDSEDPESAIEWVVPPIDGMEEDDSWT